MLDRKHIEEKVVEVVTEILALENPAKLDDEFVADFNAHLYSPSARR